MHAAVVSRRIARPKSLLLLSMDTFPAVAPLPTRRHDVDTLRALAFSLVILYHLGMYYVADWHWHIKSPQPQAWLQWPMQMLNLWRMPLVFVVSGIALALSTRRTRPGLASGQRSVRLLLPLAFGMVVVVPYQAYIQAFDQGVIDAGLGTFLVRYFSGGPWPAHAFDGAEFGATWNHLWFLPYLWLYTMVLLGGKAAMPASLRGLAERTPASVLLLLPLGLWWMASWVLWPRFPATHDLVHDAWLHALYACAFVFGYGIAQRRDAWALMVRWRWLWLLLALLSALGVWGGFFDAAVRRLWADAYAWWVLLSVLGWAHHRLNHPWPWLAWSREAVYPWYIWHQTLIVGVAFALRPLGWGVLWESLCLGLVTVLGCALLSACMARVACLRPLIGLPAHRSTS